MNGDYYSCQLTNWQFNKTDQTSDTTSDTWGAKYLYYLNTSYTVCSDTWSWTDLMVKTLCTDKDREHCMFVSSLRLHWHINWIINLAYNSLVHADLINMIEGIILFPYHCILSKFYVSCDPRVPNRKTSKMFWREVLPQCNQPDDV